MSLSVYKIFGTMLALYQNGSNKLKLVALH